MNDIERRALIGAAGIGAIAALSKAGPLNPPAGSVASSGRTLDEVYNKIPAVGGSDGRIPIPGGTAAVTLSQPGSYVLTGNITVAGTAITITASGVTLDLNGFRVTNSLTTFYCIYINSAGAQTAIRNGSLSGGMYGVYTISAGNVTLVEDVTVYNPRLMGLYINGAPGCTARNCRVIGAGSTTTAADTTNIYGINMGSAGARIERCTVASCEHNGTVPGSIRAFNTTTSGGTVDGCQAINDLSIAGSTGFYLGNNTAYRNCTAYNFPTKYSLGIDGGGNV